MTFRRSWLAVPMLLALAGCSSAPKNPEANAPVQKYAFHGEVLSVDPQGHLAKIKGEKIEGWMEAMTMDYPVKDQGELSKLTAGEKIKATVFVQGTDYWLGDITRAGE